MKSKLTIFLSLVILITILAMTSCTIGSQAHVDRCPIWSK